MKFLFHLGHPAHFHLFHHTISSLKAKGHQVHILIKKKDVLENLVQQSGFEYTNILPEGRKDKKWQIAIGQLKQDWQVLKYCLKNRPDLLTGTSVAISHVGKLLRIPSVNVNEDDADVVPLYAKLAYPWASVILAPDVCSTGKWEAKTIHYPGYHELAFLHPNQFTPLKEVASTYLNPDEPYFLIRFAKLGAHHDKGIRGIETSIAQRLVESLKPFGRIIISSERELDTTLEEYRLPVNPSDIHHLMAYARLYIGDSQSMAAEAGVLGTPFIRFNDFVGRIGYLNDLERKYNLGIGIDPSKPELLISEAKRLASDPETPELFQKRRSILLKDKIDTARFLTHFLMNYPQSRDNAKREGYFNSFKKISV